MTKGSAKFPSVCFQFGLRSGVSVAARFGPGAVRSTDLAAAWRGVPSALAGTESQPDDRRPYLIGYGLTETALAPLWEEITEL